MLKSSIPTPSSLPAVSTSVQRIQKLWPLGIARPPIVKLMMRRQFAELPSVATFWRRRAVVTRRAEVQRRHRGKRADGEGGRVGAVGEGEPFACGGRRGAAAPHLSRIGDGERGDDGAGVVRELCAVLDGRHRPAANAADRAIDRGGGAEAVGAAGIARSGARRRRGRPRRRRFRPRSHTSRSAGHWTATCCCSAC